MQVLVDAVVRQKPRISIGELLKLVHRIVDSFSPWDLLPSSCLGPFFDYPATIVIEPKGDSPPKIVSRRNSLTFLKLDIDVVGKIGSKGIPSHLASSPMCSTMLALARGENSFRSFKASFKFTS